MRPDPPVRKDGMCAVCKQPRQELTPRHRRYGGVSLLFDPFCSRVCTEAWRFVYEDDDATGLAGHPDGSDERW